MRRKDAPQSALKAVEQDESIDSICKQSSSNIKRSIEIVSIIIMVLTCCFLVYNMYKKVVLQPAFSQLSTSTQKGSQLFFINKAPDTYFSTIMEELNANQHQIQAYKRKFIESSQCKIVQGQLIQCFMNIADLNKELK